jgi:hypothetical protein
MFVGGVVDLHSKFARADSRREALSVESFRTLSLAVDPRSLATADFYKGVKD